jgi:predicted N-formylglutamate amidohydrolase
MSTSGEVLLSELDGPAFQLERPDGRSPYLLVCDHASNRLPRALGTLGLPPEELSRHIAWDIGIAGMAHLLSRKLDACCVLSGYSRLVIDANRRPDVATSIVTISEHTEVPGNRDLSAQAIAQRQREIFAPYHACIDAQLDRRAAQQKPTLFCSLHSFTPVFKDTGRQWHAAVLYDRDPRLGHALRDRLRAEPGLVIGDNQPYAVSDTTDYTVIVHGEQRGVPYLEIEIRQDLLGSEAGQSEWAERLARLLPELIAEVPPVVPR